MTVRTEIRTLVASRIADAWPGTTLAGGPTPMAGGFWAAMYRLRLSGQPGGVPAEVVFRIAPDEEMGAKEIAVQRTVAEMEFATPRVRLAGSNDDELGGVWSVMDFAAGAPPLGDLNGVAALRRAPALFARMPVQLAVAMAGIHALDPDPVSIAVADAAPTAAWSVDQLLGHFEAAAEGLGRSELVGAIRQIAQRRPHEGATVICHGDLHPFNLLVDESGAVTVVDWTAAIRAEPAYDVAFTAMLLGNPPLDAPGPLRRVIHWLGRRLAGRFVHRYRAIAPQHDLRALDWYRALHGTRIMVEAASIEAQAGPEGSTHPFTTLMPAATAAIRAVTGVAIAST